MIQEVYNAICDGTSHPAMGDYDNNVVLEDIKKALGDGGEGSEIEYQLDFKEGSSQVQPWIIVMTWSEFTTRVQAALLQIVMKHNLLLYNPQNVTVWNNKRAY